MFCGARTVLTDNPDPWSSSDHERREDQGPASYFPSIEKTYGRPIAEWKALVHAAMPARHMELVTMLKAQHGMGHGHANAIVADMKAKGEL